MIRRIASSYEAKPHLAQELAQDIYLAVWRALPSFRVQASSRTFVARIATNRAITHVVRAMKDPLPVALDDSIAAPEDPERQAIEQDQKERMMGAMRELPLVLRQAALLAAEGLTPQEIAEVLGISSNAASVRLSRAKDRLRQLLKVGHEHE